MEKVQGKDGCYSSLGLELAGWKEGRLGGTVLRGLFWLRKEFRSYPEINEENFNQGNNRVRVTFQSSHCV